MTYFENHDSENEPVFMDYVANSKQEMRTRNNVNKGFKTAGNERFENSNNDKRLDNMAPFENFEHVKTSKRDENVNDEWSPMETVVEKKTRHGERTTKFDMAHSENENSLDLDVEIKPLSISDDKEKTKLSSIPEKPVAEKNNLHEIEHVQTKLVDPKPSKKVKVGMLIGVKLNETKGRQLH